MSNPAGRDYQVSQLLARLADLEERCARMERATGVYAERARISGVGGAMVVVTYPTGTTRTLPRSSTYSPVVNDQVLVLNSPAWSGVVCKVSA